MSHSELAIAGLYDHEHEAVREQQRRVPDWGGDDVFASTPRRRRFEHRDERGGHLRRRDTHEHALPGRDEPAPVADAPPEDQPSPTDALVLGDAPVMTADPYLEEPQIAANGRRVVTITGHPGATTRTARPLDVAPRRAPRTWDERLTQQPERIAMWAFALGLLLIVIAVASS